MPSPLRATALIIAILALSGPTLALAHYTYEDASLLAMSADGALGLFSVVEGDTEGGAEGELLVIARLEPGVTPTGLVSILGDDHEALVAHQEVLPYIPSPGAMMEHSPEQLARAPRLREAFLAGPVKEHGLTIEPSSRALPGAGSGRWEVGNGRILTATLREDRSASLQMGVASAKVAAPWSEDLTCVEAVYRTGDPATFVVQIFAVPASAPPECPADRR